MISLRIYRKRIKELNEAKDILEELVRTKEIGSISQTIDKADKFLKRIKPKV